MKAVQLEISGIVQGVGFRPFIYQLAARLDIKGEVANTSRGVTIHIEGEERKIDFFLEELVQNPFINCTNCGPRYSIISDIPYDRPNTSMKHFQGISTFEVMIQL